MIKEIQKKKKLILDDIIGDSRLTIADLTPGSHNFSSCSGSSENICQQKVQSCILVLWVTACSGGFIPTRALHSENAAVKFLQDTNIFL